MVQNNRTLGINDSNVKMDFSSEGSRRRNFDGKKGSFGE